MPKDSSEGRTFLAACIQFDVRQGDVAANLEQARHHIAEAVAAGAELLVLPEMWGTSFVPEFSDELLAASAKADEELVELSARHGLMIVGGGPEKAEGALYNRVLVADRGKVLGSYRKIHLFTPHGEPRQMTAGEEPLILDTRLGRLGILICYDIRFPELVRYHFYQHVEILAVPAQWPEARARHWRVLLQACAITNQMFVIGCNRTGQEPSLKTDENMVFPGDSRIIDPMGEILSSGAGECGTLVAEIQRRKIRTMRRIMPVRKDRRPDVYEKIWKDIWPG